MTGIEATVTPEIALFNIVRRDSCFVIGAHAECTGESRLRASIDRFVPLSSASSSSQNETVNQIRRQFLHIPAWRGFYS